MRICWSRHTYPRRGRTILTPPLNEHNRYYKRAKLLRHANKSCFVTRKRHLIRKHSPSSGPTPAGVPAAGSSGTMSLTLSHHHGQSEGEEFSAGVVAILLHLVYGSKSQTWANGSEFYTGLMASGVQSSSHKCSLSIVAVYYGAARVFVMVANVLCYCTRKYSEVTALLLCLPYPANRHDILGVLCAPWEHEKAL
jgi:hypothetical protein